MTPREIAALGEVRIREGGERRQHSARSFREVLTCVRLYARTSDGVWNVDRRNADRRNAVSPRAAELAAEVERLRGFQGALEENARLHKLLDDSQRLLAEADRDWLSPDQRAVMERQARVLATGIAAGACLSEDAL
jgi:hypothetical protein